MDTASILATGSFAQSLKIFWKSNNISTDSKSKPVTPKCQRLSRAVKATEAFCHLEKNGWLGSWTLIQQNNKPRQNKIDYCIFGDEGEQKMHGCSVFPIVHMLDWEINSVTKHRQVSVLLLQNNRYFLGKSVKEY